MNSYQKIMARIEADEKIIIDGATGTELERHGVPQLENAWNGGGTLSHPEIPKMIHKEYIRAGDKNYYLEYIRDPKDCP